MASNTITRRTALAGAAALPMLPAAAMAGGAEALSHYAEQDPFVAAFCAYVDAEQAFIRIARERDNDEITNAAGDAAEEAMLRMAQTVPTTTVGLMLAISALLPVFGEPENHDSVNLFDFDCMRVHESWTNGSCEALLRSLYAGAENVLGKDASA